MIEKCRRSRKLLFETELYESFSTLGLDFLPGAGLKLPAHGKISLFIFFFSYSVHVAFSGHQMLAEKNFPRHGLAFSKSAMTVRP